MRRRGPTGIMACERCDTEAEGNRRVCIRCGKRVGKCCEGSSVQVTRVGRVLASRIIACLDCVPLTAEDLARA